MSEQQSEVEYVGFWTRFLAFIIDSIAAGIAVGVVITILFGSFEAPATFEDVDDLYGRFSVQTLLSAAIFISLWIWLASTPGKLIFNAYIVDARTLGRASPGQLVVRYLGYFLSTFVFMLGFLWIAFDKRKQGWHDKIAGTLVIRGKPREPDTGTDDQS